MKLAPQQTVVNTTKAEIVCFQNYLVHCEVQGWTKMHTNPFFHSLLKYSYLTLLEKLWKHIFKMGTDRADHKCKFKINQAERTVCSILFKLENVPVQISNLEFQIINNLHLQ